MIELHKSRDRDPHELRIPQSELSFETTRSQGPGGQNVNKVETKVRLYFNPWNSSALTWEQKGLLARSEAVQRATNEEGLIVITCQEHRSQHANKERAIVKLHILIGDALKPKEERIETEAPESADKARMRSKTARSRLKQLRREQLDPDGE